MAEEPHSETRAHRVGCLSDETVAGFVAGRLPAAASARIENHMDACPLCRRHVSDLARRDGPTRNEGSEPRTLGRYQLVRTLGRGAMGVVYLARDPELGRDVAVKLLRPLPRTNHAEAKERLRREAQAMALLSHPHVVGVHDLGIEDEQPFVAMELVKGQTLADWCSVRVPDPSSMRAAKRRLLARITASALGCNLRRITTGPVRMKRPARGSLLPRCRWLCAHLCDQVRRLGRSEAGAAPDRNGKRPAGPGEDPRVKTC